MKLLNIFVLIVFLLFIQFWGIQLTAQEDSDAFKDYGIAVRLLDSMYKSIDDFVDADIKTDSLVKNKLKSLEDSSLVFEYRTIAIKLKGLDSIFIKYPFGQPIKRTKWKLKKKYLKFQEQVMIRKEIPYDLIDKFFVSFYLVVEGDKLLFAYYEVGRNNNQFQILNKTIDYYN
jgi:hypothetical protein